jgi:hypothetical protein
VAASEGRRYTFVIHSPEAPVNVLGSAQDSYPHGQVMLDSIRHPGDVGFVTLVRDD